MKIFRAKTRPYGLPFRRALRTASGTFAVRRGTLVSLTDATGCCGWGDAAPWPGFGSDAADVEARLDALPAMLVERSVDDDVEAIAEAARVAGELPEISAAIEQALLDLLGQRRRAPLHALLGGARSEVEVHALVADPDEAVRAVSAGVRALKLKAGGRDPEADISTVAAVRRAVGARIGLRVDANGAWDARTACDVAHRLSLIGVDWIEQPVPAGDIEGLVAVRKASPVRVAADEAIDGGGALDRLLRARAVDGVTLKPQMLGGLVATQRLARRALEAGLEVCITHAFESIIGRTGVLHLAASLEADGPHGLGHPFARDLAPVDPDLAGHLVVPTAPGLGVAPSHPTPRTMAAAQEAAS